MKQEVIDLIAETLEIDKDDPRTVVLTWDSSFCGQFELRYANFSKTIVVESLF